MNKKNEALAEQPTVKDCLTVEQPAQQSYCNDCGGFDPKCPLAQPEQPSKPLTRDELRHMYQNLTAWQFYCDVDERLFGRPAYGIKGDA